MQTAGVGTSTLEIIIPYYQEGEEVIKPLLESIKKYAYSTPTIIIHDGYEKPLSKEFLSEYPFARFIEIEHGGISWARRHGQEMATADYIMFCDDDDEFTDYIDCVFEEMEDEFDVLTSPFDEKGKRTLENESTFIHGKVFRRHFLELMNIKWCDELQVIEDGYFVAQAMCFGQVRKVKKCFYRWNERDNSTSSKEDFVWLEWDYALRARELLVDSFISHGYIDQAIASISIQVELAWHFANIYGDDKRIEPFIEKYKDIYERRQEAVDLMNAEYPHEIKIDFNEWFKTHSNMSGKTVIAT